MLVALEVRCFPRIDDQRILFVHGCPWLYIWQNCTILDSQWPFGLEPGQSTCGYNVELEHITQVYSKPRCWTCFFWGNNSVSIWALHLKKPKMLTSTGWIVYCAIRGGHQSKGTAMLCGSHKVELPDLCDFSFLDGEYFFIICWFLCCTPVNYCRGKLLWL